MTKLQPLCKHVSLPLYQTFNKQQSDELLKTESRTTARQQQNVIAISSSSLVKIFKPFLFLLPVQVMRGSFYVSFNLMAVECNSQRSKFDRFRDKAPLGFHTIEVFLTSDPDFN